jgi:N-acetylglucosaminyl-diphospho-decaprenol L-rhamnosyltransferase
MTIAPPPDVSVLIATYNMRDDVLRCLDSLAAVEAVTPLEIIVVENGSSDGAGAAIRARHPHVRVIELARNVGWTRANNEALAEARGAFLLLLNADTVVEPDAVAHLRRYLIEHPETGIVAPTMLNDDGTLQETARRLPRPINAIFGRHSWLTRAWPANPFSRRYLQRDVDATAPFEADWVSAAAAMFPRAVLDRVGPLDETFTHWVDADWCIRVTAAGWKVRCVPQARVHHLEGYGRGRKRPRTIVAFHRGVYRLYRKHYARGLKRPLLGLAALGLAVRCSWLLMSNSLKRAD